MPSSDSAITVALVNDYEVVVHGLSRMFDGHIGRVRVVELDATVQVATPVDVALYDTFAQTQGEESEVRQILANPRARRVAVYTWNLQPELIHTALGQGADGYLSKALSAGELVDAVERIHRGERVVSDPVPEGDVPVADGEWPGLAEGLTCREAEVIALITQGLSNKDIAARTRLSINSVKSYIRLAYRKMGVVSRTQAVLWGVAHGFEPDRARLVLQ